MNAHFHQEMMKIALSGYRKEHGVLLDNHIPLVKDLPKLPEEALDTLRRKIRKSKTAWSHDQVAFPVAGREDLRRMGFRVDPLFAVPLPGEKWFTKTWRRGRLHVHQRGPLYLLHEDRNPGFPRTVKDLKHLLEDVPPALIARLTGSAKPPVILPNRGRKR